MPLDFRRGPTSKKLLAIQWVHPVWKPEQKKDAKPGETVAAQVERALPVEQAFAWIADGDRRPLLVLRECEKCKGTDHALLSQALDNEQTVLLTYWFRCVKLPTHVLTPEHPFYNLFKREKDGDRVPHLFFADADGGNRRELPGDQTQAVLWETMFSYLERCYAENAKDAIKELRQLMGQFDQLDSLERDAKARLDTEIEKNGPDSPRAKKLGADVSKLGRDRQKLFARERDLRELAMKTPKPAVGAGAAK